MSEAWTESADSLAKSALELIREGLTPGPRGAPVQPGPVFFGIVLQDIQQQEGITSRRKAARRLAVHLSRSAKLSDDDRKVIGYRVPRSI